MNDFFCFQGATIRRDESTGEIFVARVIHGGLADRSGKAKTRLRLEAKRCLVPNNRAVTLHSLPSLYCIHVKVKTVAATSV